MLLAWESLTVTKSNQGRTAVWPSALSLPVHIHTVYREVHRALVKLQELQSDLSQLPLPPNPTKLSQKFKNQYTTQAQHRIFFLSNIERQMPKRQTCSFELFKDGLTPFF